MNGVNNANFNDNLDANSERAASYDFRSSR